MEAAKNGSLELTASGPQDYQTRIVITLEGKKANSALGVHKIDNTVHGPPPLNLVSLTTKGTGLKRGSQAGLAVIMEQSDRLVTGVIYGLRMQNYLGVQTDLFPIVRIRVETPSPQP